MSSPGTIIVLNGPSAAGKSSIQREIQDSFERPYLATGIDQLMLHMVPDRYLVRDVADNREVFWAETSRDAGGAPLHCLRFGPDGYRFIDGMHHTIQSLALCGNNVVVDYIALEEPWLPRLAGLLDGLTAYLVGVYAPLSVLEERAKSRPYPAGIARAQYEVVHKHGIYDLELDTSVLSIKECAEAVRELIHRQVNPTAFERLRTHFAKMPEALALGR